jgi:DNA primase
LGPLADLDPPEVFLYERVAIMPFAFREHRDGSGLTVQFFGFGERGIDIIGPIPDDANAHVIKKALERLERVMFRHYVGPRPKEQSRGRQRPRPDALEVPAAIDVAKKARKR